MICDTNARSSVVKILAAFFLLLSGYVLWAGTSMNIKLQPVSVDNAESVTGVQLLNGTGVQILVGYGNRLVPEGASGAGRLPELNIDSPYGSTWEARRLDAGTLAAIYTQPGSAISWVVSRTSSGEDEKRLHSETFALYFQPRYVKGPAADPPVTAIRYQGSRADVVLFASDNRTSAPRTLGEPSKSLTDARLLQDSTGYWLFTLVNVPGHGASAGPRKCLSGDRTAGILHATRLNKDLKAEGSAIRILGVQPVYEFDVAPVPNDDVSILATTRGGAIYAKAALTDSALPPDAWKETPFERPLSSPSLIVREGVAHCAAVQDVETPDARVLRGRIE